MKRLARIFIISPIRTKIEGRVVASFMFLGITLLIAELIIRKGRL